MYAQALVDALTVLIKVHGDQPVEDEDGMGVCSLEFLGENDGGPLFCLTVDELE